MTILHAHSEPQFTEHLCRVLAEVNGQPHSADIAVSYFYLSGFAPSRRPAGSKARQGAHPHWPYQLTSGPQHLRKPCKTLILIPLPHWIK